MSREIEQAVSINAQACEFCPAVHVNLIDAEGDVFASGSVPIDTVEPFIDQIRAAVAELAKRHSAPVMRQ
jgi:hypothetical protein